MSQETADRKPRQAHGCHGIPPIRKLGKPLMPQDTTNRKARQAHGCHRIPPIGKLGKCIDVMGYRR